MIMLFLYFFYHIHDLLWVTDGPRCRVIRELARLAIAGDSGRCWDLEETRAEHRNAQGAKFGFLEFKHEKWGVNHQQF
jgi:hypothetical protein